MLLPGSRAKKEDTHASTIVLQVAEQYGLVDAGRAGLNWCRKAVDVLFLTNLRMEFFDHILFWKGKDLSKKLGQYAGQEE